jgi:hypothetical protein
VVRSGLAVKDDMPLDEFAALRRQKRKTIQNWMSDIRTGKRPAEDLPLFYQVHGVWWFVGARSWLAALHEEQKRQALSERFDRIRLGD